MFLKYMYSNLSKKSLLKVTTKDTIYKIRNDVCFTGVNNHATFQHFKNTWGQSLYFEANMTIK